MILRWINVNRRNPNRNVQLPLAYLGPLPTLNDLMIRKPAKYGGCCFTSLDATP